MCSLPTTDYRCKKLNLLPLRKHHNLIYHLVYGLLADLSSTFRAVWNSHTGIQKTEIIIDLRYSSHSRTGIPVR